MYFCHSLCVYLLTTQYDLQMYCQDSYRSDGLIKTAMALSRSMCIASERTLYIMVPLWNHETVMPLNHNCCFAVYYKSHQILQLNGNHSHSFQSWVHKIQFQPTVDISLSDFLQHNFTIHDRIKESICFESLSFNGIL